MSKQTEAERIKELEAKLEAIQKAESNGKDPETLAKARQYARMAWADVVTCLEATGYGDIGEADVKAMQEALLEKKYNAVSGANKGSLAWQE